MQKEAMLYEKLDNSRVHCYLCAHHCRIAPGHFGFCGVRKNEGGTLYTLVYGDLIASHVDPIEKKPLYHFYPGSYSYSVATPGCNFRCGFCQNWQISQITKKDGSAVTGEDVMPDTIVERAIKGHCKSISYTYTEPTIFLEYAYDTARRAREKGLLNVFVSNGYLTIEAVEKIQPYLDAINVDLKSFREEFYKKICKAHLKPVTDAISALKKANVWIEITTLIIPGENDSEQELEDIAGFIAETGTDIPWHLSRFHPDYQYRGRPPTSVDTLLRAREIGKTLGLKYVYLGNVAEGYGTYCYSCGALLVERIYLSADNIRIENGHCPSCNALIEGYWE